MRLIRKILLILLAFVAMVLCIAWFLPATFTVDATIDINQSLEESEQEFSETENWSEWIDWKLTDSAESDMKALSFVPLPGKGEHIFSGTLLQISPVEVASKETWSFEATETGSRIHWTSSGTLEYPLGRIYGLVLPEFRRTEMQARLDSLRNFLESASNVPPQPLQQVPLYQPE